MNGPALRRPLAVDWIPLLKRKSERGRGRYDESIRIREDANGETVRGQKWIGSCAKDFKIIVDAIAIGVRLGRIGPQHKFLRVGQSVPILISQFRRIRSAFDQPDIIHRAEVAATSIPESIITVHRSKSRGVGMARDFAGRVGVESGASVAIKTQQARIAVPALEGDGRKVPDVRDDPE